MKQKKVDLQKEYKSKNNGILFMLILVLVLTLTVGYGAFISDLGITGEATFRVQEDIRITNIELYETTNSAMEEYTSKYAKNTINVGINLKEQTSTVTYKVTIANTGNVAMWIDSITNEIFNNDSIEYTISGLEIKELIYPGEVKTLDITFKYKDNVAITNTILDARLFFKFMKPESILAAPKFPDSYVKIRSDGDEEAQNELINEILNTSIFNGELSRLMIESITFSPTLNVGANAIGHWDASERKDGSVVAWYTDDDNNGLYELTIGGNEKVIFPESSYFMFMAFINLKSINFDYADTSRVKDMQFMFALCSSLTELNFSKFNTSNVTAMNHMFAGTGLTKLDLSTFNTEKVTDMSGMFMTNENLTSLNVTGFVTNKVTDMADMFNYIPLLTKLDLSDFNTEKVIDMHRMFNNNPSLESINLSSSFKTAEVTDMYNMFAFCESLTNLDLSMFDISSVTDTDTMFSDCSSLTMLDISSMDFSKLTESMIRSMLYGVPREALVYVKDEETVDLINKWPFRFDPFTNIQIKEA